MLTPFPQLRLLYRWSGSSSLDPRDAPMVLANQLVGKLCEAGREMAEASDCPDDTLRVLLMVGEPKGS